MPVALHPALRIGGPSAVLCALPRRNVRATGRQRFRIADESSIWFATAIPQGTSACVSWRARLIHSGIARRLTKEAAA